MECGRPFVGQKLRNFGRKTTTNSINDTCLIRVFSVQMNVLPDIYKRNTMEISDGKLSGSNDITRGVYTIKRIGHCLKFDWKSCREYILIRVSFANVARSAVGTRSFSTGILHHTCAECGNYNISFR